MSEHPMSFCICGHGQLAHLDLSGRRTEHGVTLSGDCARCACTEYRPQHKQIQPYKKREVAS